MDEDDFVVDNGLLFGAYESGPWVGYVVPGGKELEGWVAAGEEHYEFMVRKLIFLGDRSDIYIIMTCTIQLRLFNRKLLFSYVSLCTKYLEIGASM